jgi:O-antigen/teichoic acid export membrane protein
VNPVVAALLFHALGLRLFAKRRLTPFVLKLNVVALVATAAAMALAGLEWGFTGVAVAWLVGHTVWSITLAVLVHRGVATRHDAEQ